MIAPSEKHLEDYLAVSIPEAEPGAYIVKRQAVLPSGIADLIVLNPVCLSVIELKKGLIDVACVAQVLRYMADLQGIYINVVNKLVDQKTLAIGEYAYAFRSMNAKILGMLIGSGYTDKHIPVICEGANIALYTYDYDPDTGYYSFSFIAAPSKRTASAAYQNYFDPSITLALKDLAFNCAKEYAEVHSEGQET